MTYSPFYCYFQQCWFLLCFWCNSSETSDDPTCCFRTCAETSTAAWALTTDVSPRSDHTPHTLHSTADHQSPLQPNHVPHTRNRTSTQTIMTDTHATRLERLHRRLIQARQADARWPGGTSLMQVLMIEDEIRQMDQQHTPAPTWRSRARSMISCASRWIRL